MIRGRGAITPLGHKLERSINIYISTLKCTKPQNNISANILLLFDSCIGFFLEIWVNGIRNIVTCVKCLDGWSGL